MTKKLTVTELANTYSFAELQEALRIKHEKDLKALETLLASGQPDLFQLALFVRPIHDLNFSNRTFNGLKRFELLTFADLMFASEEDLSFIRGFGKMMVNEVRNKLAEYGFSLSQQSIQRFAAVTLKLLSELDIILPAGVEEFEAEGKYPGIYYRLVILLQERGYQYPTKLLAERGFLAPDRYTEVV